MLTGEQLRKAREQRGLSRPQLAKMTGLTESKIYTIERGRHMTPVERVKLGEVFGFDPSAMTLRRETDFGTLVGPELQIGETFTVLSPTEATLTPPSTGGGPIAEAGVRLISHSELADFKSCRRRWWLRWHRGLRPREDEPIGPRAIGNRIHQSLALYYTPGYVNSLDPVAALELLIARDWTTLSTTLPGLAGDLRKQFDSEANLERAMVSGYVDWLSDTGSDAYLDVTAPESYVEHSIGPYRRYEDVRLIGRLDVRVRRTTDGSAMFLDHKTVQNFVQPSRTLKLDEQMLHYHLLERRGNDLATARSDGALYNMIRRVKRTPQARPPFYERLQVRHNDHEIESYAKRTEGTVLDLLKVEERVQAPELHRSYAYPRPSRECLWCPFFEVCPMFDDGSRAEDMLEARFQTGDPLDYYRQPAPLATADQGAEE